MLWGGEPGGLFDLADDGGVALFTSVAMLNELAGILERKKFAAKIAASGLTIDQIVNGYTAYATTVRPNAVPRIAPDPDDDMVVGTALAAHADMIVTGDKPFLSVGKWQQVEIVTVQQAIERLKKSPGSPG